VKPSRLVALATLGSLCLGSAAHADENHYKNILVGERGAGLGGAFAAISDDPSGMFYNPAGLAFSFENYISLSANAFSATTIRYKNIVANQDYTLTSAAFVPAFFGFTQSLGKYKAGFGVVVPNSDLFDQNDLIENFSTAAGRANQINRRLFRQDITYLVGPAVAKEVFENFSVGISLFAQARFHRYIDNQLVTYNPRTGGDPTRYLVQNAYLDESAFALAPKLGFQWMPMPKWSIGLAISRAFNLKGSGKVKMISTPTYTEEEAIAAGDTTLTGTPRPVTGEFTNDLKVTNQTGSSYLPEVLQVSLGNAYFFSKTFLVSADVDFFGPDAATNRVTTFNVAVGAEYYVLPTLPLRIGLYSDRSNRAAVVTGKKNQFDHVDRYGGTVGFSWINSGSSFSMGFGSTKGSGQGQTLADASIQTLQSSQLNVFLMGSYQL
jgi:long-chain fatty acid transport protein